MSYDPIDFAFQVHNDRKRIESAYLVPEGLMYGATLEVTPSQAEIEPGTSAIFSCRLSLDRAFIRPGCENDQGFELTAWRVHEHADERWGSCFYFVRPRVRTTLQITSASWYDTDLTVQGSLGLDTDTSVQLADQMPLRARVRLEVDAAGTLTSQWALASVQAGGSFVLSRKDFKGPFPAELRVQAWFDRTDLLASARSKPVVCQHQKIPIPG